MACFMAILHSDVLPNDLCSKLHISSEKRMSWGSIFSGDDSLDAMNGGILVRVCVQTAHAL